ncbi:hypothetical protein VTO42DRAFT_5477 [Malbranchea cinnamomea]
MRTLVAVGACYIDKILTVDHYPKEDEKLRASSISQRRGGNALNSLQVLQQLLLEREQNSGTSDSETALAATFAPLYAVAVLPRRTSPAIQEIEASLGSRVDIQHCIYREESSEPASSYIIKSRSTGTRTIVNYNELQEMTVEEFIRIVDNLPAGPKWFHFEGRIPDVTLKCIRHIRQHYPFHKVSVEVEKPGRQGLEELAAEADVVFYSKSWAHAKGYHSPKDFLHAQSPLTPKASVLCCTWGEKGAASLDKSRMKYFHAPAFTDTRLPVVDTIGAGDTFIAGVLYGLLCHEDDYRIEAILDFANCLAGRKVTQEGFEGLARAMREYV